MTNEHLLPRKTKITLSIATAVLATLIFVADTITPLDIAVATLYVVVVLMAARFCPWRGVVGVVLGCVALTILSWMITPPGAPATEAIVNECISMATIGLVTALAFRAQQTESTLRSKQ